MLYLLSCVLFPGAVPVLPNAVSVKKEGFFAVIVHALLMVAENINGEGQWAACIPARSFVPPIKN